jgi:hypothetical protein
MSLRSLSDKELLAATERLVQEERSLITEVLRHLREIETRKLYSELGCKSLFDYAVKKLGYAEAQAFRRINAMRLLKDLPEIEQKIDQGVINLTSLSLASSTAIILAVLAADSPRATISRSKFTDCSNAKILSLRLLLALISICYNSARDNRVQKKDTSL